MVPDLVGEIDEAHARVCAGQRELLALIARIDREQLWHDDGARDAAHWLAMRYGISTWKAHRWIGAAHALEHLPELAQALTCGLLGLDKVTELARFATAATEHTLIGWAGGVSVGAIRHRGDLAARQDLQAVVDAERYRCVSWWYDNDGQRFVLQADLPAAQGGIVARTLERMSQSIPVLPGEEWRGAPARRADALVALCSAHIARDPDPDRATVVIHAQLEGLVSGSGGCEIENGPVIHPEVARRLLCHARVQTVVEDASGAVLGVGRMRREPSAALLRQVAYRDRGCRFPGCGTRAFTQAHHVVFWRRGGATELDNLLLICSFHHRLVHEHRWSVQLDADGSARWFMPGGVAYRAGSSPEALALDHDRALDRAPVLVS